METHIITYCGQDNRTLGYRAVYDLTNEQAVRLLDILKDWAKALFPDCTKIKLDSIQSGDAIMIHSYNV